MLGGTLGAATQASPQNMQNDKPSVLVVGAGLIGASVAMHLAKKGCHVQVLEANKPASGMSSDNSAIETTKYSKSNMAYISVALQAPAANPGLG